MHGPKPRDYSQRISKKEKALALNGALTVRLREGAVKVVEFPTWFVCPECRALVQSKNLERDNRATLLVETGHEYTELRGAMIEAEAVLHRDFDTVLAVYEGELPGHLLEEATVRQTQLPEWPALPTT